MAMTMRNKTSDNDLFLKLNQEIYTDRKALETAKPEERPAIKDKIVINDKRLQKVKKVIEANKTKSVRSLYF